MKKALILLVSILLFCGVAAGQESVAFLGVTNRSESINSDYLNGIIEGILLFDLSQVRAINLVERRDLDDVLQEQKMSLYGLTDDDAGEIGKIIKADTLLACEYVASDTLRVTARLIDVKSSSTRALSVTGETENTIHELAELIVSELGAGAASFTDPDQERSVFTFKDIRPGHIMLYCNLIRAEILLNETFVGYTTGDLYTPLELPDIDPGTYDLRINCGNDFGVIDLPQVTFRDWEEEVRVRPGRQSIVRAVIRDFNSQIYNMMKLIRDEINVNENNRRESVSDEVVYTDRQGNTHKVQLSLTAELVEGKGVAKGTLIYDNEPFSFTVNGDNKFEEFFKNVSIEIKVNDGRNQRSTISYTIERKDLYQGMFRDQ